MRGAMLGGTNAVVTGGNLSDLNPPYPWQNEANCVPLQQTPDHTQTQTDNFRASLNLWQAILQTKAVKYIF